MVWLVLAAVAFAVAVRWTRRDRRLAVSPSQPVSTLRLNLSRKHTSKTKAALDAASSTLR